ncbi:MAG: hypothetical protein WC073_11335 [Sterolibacterium sp.]
MILDLNDLHSQTWSKIKAHFTERLQDHRTKNDGRLTENDTAYLRGRIAEAQHILQMGEDEVKLLKL